jgi:hypothetical protein
MHVRNERSNLLFEAMKAILKCIKRLGITLFMSVVRIIIVRASIWSVRVMLLGFMISRRRLWMVTGYIVFAYETLDVFLGVTNATREF